MSLVEKEPVDSYATGIRFVIFLDVALLWLQSLQCVLGVTNVMKHLAERELNVRSDFCDTNSF